MFSFRTASSATMARRWCAFTSSTSRWDAQATADCSCRSTAHSWVTCSDCIDGKALDRCSAWLLQQVRHEDHGAHTSIPEIETSMGVRAVMEPALVALLQLDWDGAIARGEADRPAF